MKEKLAAGLSESVPTEAGAPSPPLVARDALVGLGYTILEAEKALTAVDPELPTEERIRQALKAA